MDTLVEYFLTYRVPQQVLKKKIVKVCLQKL